MIHQLAVKRINIPKRDGQRKRISNISLHLILVRSSTNFTGGADCNCDVLGNFLFLFRSFQN
jgi:hypothetical protein